MVCLLYQRGPARVSFGTQLHDYSRNTKLILLSSSAIIEEIMNIRKSRSALLAYYYFDFKDAAKRDVRGLLTSLLLQLVDDSDTRWELLCRLHKTCRDGSEQPSVATLAQCLNSMIDLPDQIPTYIIIDALDECPNNTGTPSARERVLDLAKHRAIEAF